MKRLILFVAVCCLSLSAFAANPSFQSFNANQFDVTGNRVAIKDGVQITNLVLFGAESNILEVYDQDDDLKFYIDSDGVIGIPYGRVISDISGGSAPGFLLIATNSPSKLLSIKSGGATVIDLRNSGSLGLFGDGLYVEDQSDSADFSYYENGFLELYIDSRRLFAATPNIVSGITPYVLDTFTNRTTGNILEVKNNGTNKFVVPFDGATETESIVVNQNISVKGNANINTLVVTNNITIGGNLAATYAGITNVLTWALSDMTTALTTGTNKNYWYAPSVGMTIKFVRATLATASSSGTPTFDINEAGTSILSTKITIDANEWDSFTAATPPVISDSAIAANAKVDFDIDVAGTAAAGAQIQIGFTVP